MTDYKSGVGDMDSRSASLSMPIRFPNYMYMYIVSHCLKGANPGQPNEGAIIIQRSLYSVGKPHHHFFSFPLTARREVFSASGQSKPREL